jgi:DNA-directed RNA polymerase subunit RPC12/RpoP
MDEDEKEVAYACFACSKCGWTILVKPAQGGSNVECPNCKLTVRIPHNWFTPLAARTVGDGRSIAPRNSPSGGTVDYHLVDFIAAELRRDIEYLTSLGIKLDKGTLAAKTGGTAWAGYEAFTGDWLSALVIGGVSLLSGAIAGGYKRIKLNEVRQKWLIRLSDLNEQQLRCLATGLQQKYPLLFHGFQRLLEGTQG